MLPQWNYLPLSVVTDGEDGSGLKLEKISQFFQVLKLSWKDYYGLLSVLNFIWHLLRNFAGALCVWVKVLSKDFNTELTWTQQKTRDWTPLNVEFDNWVDSNPWISAHKSYAVTTELHCKGTLLPGVHISYMDMWRVWFSSWLINRPFPSSLLPLFQNESKCETFHMKMSFTHKSIRMQIILIFIWKISHLDSVWNRGRRQLGNGLFGKWLGMTIKTA